MNSSACIDYKEHWDQKFRTRPWGKYPPEDLVRFIFTHYKHVDRTQIKVLELGCGPGANLWFLSREGFQTSGIDCSPTAIEIAQKFVLAEVKNASLDLKIGDFAHLPWDANAFDCVVDIFAIYANPLEVIERTLKEIERVLKPGGRGFAKFFGCETTGFGLGEKLEHHTFDNIPLGPCAQMGIAHFVTQQELETLFSRFNHVIVSRALRTDAVKGYVVEELTCHFQKKTP